MEKDKNRLIRNIIAIAIAIAFYVLYRLSFSAPDIVESVYSRGFFRFLNQAISTVTGFLPFSLAEFVFYAFIVYAAVYIVFSIINIIISSGKRLYQLFYRIVALAALAAGVFTSFIILWGFNYAREPLHKTMELNVSPVKKEVLYKVSKYLVNKANLLRKDLPEDEKGVFISAYRKEDVLTKCGDLFSEVADNKGMDYFKGSFGDVKPVLYSRGLSYAGLAGVYFPFTGEANINSDIPMLTFLFGACHEAAHQRGFAREDEASFIAYYICRESNDMNFEYSGTAGALLYALESLKKEDKAMYNNIIDMYSKAVKRDMDNYGEYWEEYEGKTQEAVEAMNNTYLKANMQEEGVKSYGRMLDLLIALYLKEQTLATASGNTPEYFILK